MRCGRGCGSTQKINPPPLLYGNGGVVEKGVSKQINFITNFVIQLCLGKPYNIRRLAPGKVNWVFSVMQITKRG